MNKPLLTVVFTTLCLVSGCSKLGITEDVKAEKKSLAARDENIQKYPLSPREEIFGPDEPTKKLLGELKERYKQNFVNLQKSVTASKAKFVVVNLTTEYGSMTYKEGEPYLAALCQELGVDYVDVAKKFDGMKPEEFTQLPKDGHLSKKGAEIVAGELEKIVKKYGDYKSGTTFPDKPKVFGDGQPNQDELLDGGKDLPYRQKMNSQGLRMDADLAFPKTKQRVLILGDSQIECPFLDNQFTATGVLQAKFADKEIINAAIVGYSVDDYLSLFEEKAKFTEPDIVIVQTGGGDILDQYFSQRNHFARTDKVYEPNETEKAFYPKITSK
jgi:lysophospholipase L1-like esterase